MAQPMKAPRMPADPGPGADPFPFQIAPPRAVRSRRFRLFALAGLAAYLLALLATIPAGLLLKRAGEPSIWLAVSGTVWSGEAALSQGHAVRWEWAPMASLANLAYTTHVQVIGADTDLNGLVTWTPGAIVIENLTGNASASLVTAIAPTLPFLCDFPMRVNMDRIAFGGEQAGAAGEIRSSSGSCASRSAAVHASTPVPPLIAEATINVGGSNGWVARQADRSERLITFATTPSGETSVSVSPTASALIPGIDVIATLAN